MFFVLRNALVLALLLPVQPITHSAAAIAPPSAGGNTSVRTEDNLGDPLIVAPMRLNRTTAELPVVRLSINGSPPLYFLFDTGCGTTLELAKGVAEQLHLEPLSDKNTTGVTAPKPIEIALVGKKDERFALPSAELRELKLLPDSVVQAFKGVKLAGIIDGSLARKYTVCIDPSLQTMTLYTPPVQPVHINGAETVPLLPSTLVQGGHMRDVEVTFPGGISKRMMLDTGSSNVVLPLTDAGQIEDLRISRKTATSTTLYGTETGFNALLPQITVGSRKESNTPAVIIRDDSEWPLLGMRFLSRFKTTLDFAHNRMLLEPAKDYAKRTRISGDVGLELETVQGKLSVSFLDLQGPAYKAGMLPQDRIETIDGIDVTKMDAAAATMLLPQHIGDSSVLRVRHNDSKENKPFEVTLTASDPFTPVSKKLGFGFNLSGGERTDSKKQILFVSAVSPGSGAADAGLRVGDEFLSIQNKTTSAMDLADVSGYFKDPAETTSLSVTVRRKDVKDPISLTLLPKTQSTLDTLPWPEASLTAAQPKVKAFVIPFQYDPPKSRLLTVRARVNGSPPLLFVVNTNLRNDFVLFSWALPSTGLKLLPAKDQPAGAGSGESYPRITSPVQMRVEGVAGPVDATIDQAYAIVIEELPVVRDYPGGRIAGLVGSNFLTDVNSVVDFDSNTILWYSVLPPAARDVSTAVFPLKKMPGNETGLYLEAIVASDKDSKGTPVTFLLDTASTNTFLPEALAGTGKDSAGKDSAGKTVMRRLTLGSINVADVTMYVGTATSEPTLGLDVLSRFTITIDNARNEIRLAPRR